MDESLNHKCRVMYKRYYSIKFLPVAIGNSGLASRFAELFIESLL